MSLTYKDLIQQIYQKTPGVGVDLVDDPSRCHTLYIRQVVPGKIVQCHDIRSIELTQRRSPQAPPYHQREISADQLSEIVHGFTPNCVEIYPSTSIDDTISRIRLFVPFNHIHSGLLFPYERQIQNQEQQGATRSPHQYTLFFE